MILDLIYRDSFGTIQLAINGIVYLWQGLELCTIEKLERIIAKKWNRGRAIKRIEKYAGKGQRIGIISTPEPEESGEGISYSEWRESC